MATGTVQSSASGDNNFFAQIKEGFSSGVKSIGQDILPVWAKQQLVGESVDKLANPTFNSNAPDAPRRLDNLLGLGGGDGTGDNNNTSRLILYGGAALALVGFLIYAVKK